MDRPLEIVLVRHGAVEERFAGRYLGSTDAPLSAEGRAQAAALGRRLGAGPWDACFASPLLRASQTLEAIRPRCPIKVDPELCEVDFGAWEARTFEEIQRDDPQAAQDWGRAGADFAFPGGERLHAFYARVGRAAVRIAQLRSGRVLVVCHGGVVRALVCWLLDLPLDHFAAFRIQYASITTVERSDGAGRLSGLNDTNHLEQPA